MIKILLTIILLLMPSLSHAWDIGSACLLQYKLNENTGSSSVADSCGSLTGTLFKPGFAVNTSVVHDTGKVGTGSFLFDGDVTSYAIDISTHSALSFARTDPWYVFAWFKTSDSTHEGDIISKIDCNSNCAGWAVEMASGKIQVLIISTVSSNWIQQLSTNTYNDGNWHLLVVNYDGSSDASGITLYVDGVAVSKASPLANNLSSAISYTNALPVVGGRNNAVTGGSIPFFGNLDDVRVGNRILTTDEITGLYNGGTGTETTTGSSSTASFFSLF